jgi:predicted metal-dependent phosphoesterase TrpH
MKNALIADPLQRDIEDVTHFFVENGFTADAGKLTRAERRRQEKQKDTVYHLTKSQIDAIKRQAVEDVTNRYKDLDQAIRNEYERQLNERFRDYERQLEERRVKDINFIMPVALMAAHDAFGWKVYKGDHYQRLLARMAEIFNNGEMDLVHIRRWVKKTLGIELKEVFGDED